MGLSVSWCDKLASTPAVGLRCDPSYAPSEQLLGALSPVLERATLDDKPQFTVDDQAPFSVSFNTEEGFKYIVDQTRIVVQFNHRVKFKPVSGGPPVMELLSKPMLYTELLEICCDKLVEANQLIRGIRIKNISRVGIVSNTVADLSEMPPGLQAMLDHLSSPWAGELIDGNIRFSVKIAENDRTEDRCHHQVIVPENKKELSTVMLDWQRFFVKQQPGDEKSLRKMLKDAGEAAIEYFEELGEGGRFNEPSRE